jgi:microcystin-dependent protein
MPLLCGAVGADTHTPHGPSHIALMVAQPPNVPPRGPASDHSARTTTTIAQRRKVTIGGKRITRTARSPSAHQFSSQQVRPVSASQPSQAMIGTLYLLYLAINVRYMWR